MTQASQPSQPPSAPLGPPSSTSAQAPPQHSQPVPVSYPPETPPMIDPSNLRYMRMTPNLRDMVSGLSQPTPDPAAHMHDILASPDPSPFYNSLTFATPILRDLYPSHSPITSSALPTHPNNADSDNASRRMQRIAGARAEMNALFNALTPTNPDTENGSDSNHDGVISLISTPDLRHSASHVPSVDTSNPYLRSKPEATPVNHPSDSQPRGSESSSVTPPPDTSILSPTTSPETTSTAQPVTTLKQNCSLTDAVKADDNKHHSKQRDNQNSRTDIKSDPTATQQKSAKPLSKAAPGTSSTALSSALSSSVPNSHTAANAVAMNPAMAGLIPYACSLPAAFSSQMMAGQIPAHFPGRPVAFVPGNPSADLLQYNMMAQAAAFHFGTAQAMQVAGRVLQSTMSPTAAQQKRPDAIGGSRKKRRRQMLERSGCTVEQARENRARALKRLRQKKSMRTQGNSVRYACRKRIAMVRPRVNGRFATKEEVEEVRRARQ
ncbi:Zinc finger protein CONSTANS-LIKE 1 [Gracilariopsis chorda]|uniref:Zinc finger protein CONSTANS-LIKE 1 n=1 Tax=Gracilariopsis chorda TaxID=448386 RepID=A0A2V3IW98_9FLOR|nr:Zinc finger protein CONSTANS-LIKE 1 [Gracilariopsis chorda]|eukprot:PXF46365.1 Zinc finger protein CONSTANS-LIKE 1 [Gracilariopsis chorda]